MAGVAREEGGEVIICLRLHDFPTRAVPETGRLAECGSCGAAIVFNPATTPAPVLKVCMQCAGIEPLPLGT